MSENCHNNLFVKPFEICNIHALTKLESKTGKTDLYSTTDITSNIFNLNFLNLNQDFNSNIRNTSTDNEYIYNYDITKKDLCYSVDSNNTQYNLNCVIAMNSPWFTYDKKNNKCSAIPNIDLPSGFKYENNYIYKETNNDDIKYAYKIEKAFCENKWYDWIITPNYQFGNQYYNDTGKFSKDDVYRCYKPCKKGYMPYTTDDGNNICIEKANALDGIYKNKLDYSPVALINLIGNNFSNCLLLYNNLFYEKLNKFKEENIGYVENEDYLIEYIIPEWKSTIKSVLNNQNLSDNILNEYKYLFIKKNYKFEPEPIKNFQSSDDTTTTRLKFTISYLWGWFTDKDTYQNLKLGFKFSNENKKIKNEIEEMFNILKQTVKKDILNEDSFVDTNNLNYDSKNFFSYKHPNFNENDEELLTLIGMGNANMLSDVILIHTYYLGYKFSNFINSEIFNINNYILKENGEIDKIKDEKNKNNLYYHIKENLGITEPNKIKRLANIFYKAINICYDNTTDFSKNLLVYTKTAIDNNKDSLPTFLTDLSDTNNLTLSITFHENPITENDLQAMVSDLKILTILKQKLSDIVFFAREDLEYIKCPNGTIRYGKECKNCSDICKDKYNCSQNCKEFCGDYCVNNNTSKTKNKCGTEKNKEEIKKFKKEDITTPVENNFDMPKVGYYFKVAIKIFFALITIYIGYIFYEIYGETIFNIYNWIEMKLLYLFYLITDYFRSRNQFKPDLDYMNQVKKNANRKYEKLYRGVKSAVR